MNLEAVISTLWPKLLSAGMSVVWALVCIFIGVKAIKYLRKFLSGVLERAQIDIGVVQFLDGFVKIAAYVILALVILAHFGVQTTSFITILGTAGVAVGLSLQGSLSNFAGGILILILKPFKVGDFVSASSCEGTVVEISLFATTLHTVDNRNVILPNGTLANGTIINYSANETRRVDMSVSVAYGSDLQKAQRVIHEILDSDERTLQEPACVVAVDELGDSGITILIRPWVLSGDYWNVKWGVLEKVHNRFAEEQIEIPFPQMTVHLENGES